MSRLSLICGVGLALVVVTGALAKDYPIKLTRPVVVGTRYKATITATRQSKSIATINGQQQPPEDQTLIVNFVGTVEVLQISKKGTSLIEEYGVEKCTQTIGGKTSELVKPGVVISVHANYDGPIVEIIGEEIPEEDIATLGELFSLNPTEITDDEVFGTKTPHKPGDTWAMNSANAVKLAKFAGVTMQDVAGTVTFVGPKPQSGVNCLEMTATWTAGKLVPPDESLPPKFSVTKSTFKATTWGLYPEDGTSLPVHEKVTEDIQRVLSGSNANRQKIVAATAGRRIREIKREPIVATPAKIGERASKPKS